MHAFLKPAVPQACLTKPLMICLQVLEETGLNISGIKFAAVANTVFPQGRHYVTIFMMVSHCSGALQSMPRWDMQQQCNQHACTSSVWFTFTCSSSSANSRGLFVSAVTHVVPSPWLGL